VTREQQQTGFGAAQGTMHVGSASAYAKHGPRVRQLRHTNKMGDKNDGTPVAGSSWLRMGLPAHGRKHLHRQEELIP
jgi:hypothetical protein